MSLNKNANMSKNKKLVKSPLQPRVNKSKAQIEAEIKQRQEADRVRGIIKNDIYPLLKDMNEYIRYVKIFLHTCTVAVEQTFENKKRDPAIRELDLIANFDSNADVSVHYAKVFDILRNESVATFQTIIKEMPDQLDRLAFKEAEAKKFSDINIDTLLG